MPDIEPNYSIEPYIGNGRPQWVLRKMFRSTHTDNKGEIVTKMIPHHNHICIVDTADEAIALVMHMDKASKTL